MYMGPLKATNTLFSDSLWGVSPADESLRWLRGITGLGVITREDEAVLEKLVHMYRQLNSKWKDANGRPFLKQYGLRKLLAKIGEAPEGTCQTVAWSTSLHNLFVEGFTVRKMKEEIAGLPQSDRLSAVIGPYLESKDFSDVRLVADFIRDLSDVRAVNTHRENKGHQKVKRRTGIDLEKDPAGGHRILARRGLKVLESLVEHFPSTH